MPELYQDKSELVSGQRLDFLTSLPFARTSFEKNVTIYILLVVYLILKAVETVEKPYKLTPSQHFEFSYLWKTCGKIFLLFHKVFILSRFFQTLSAELLKVKTNRLT